MYACGAEPIPGQGPGRVAQADQCRVHPLDLGGVLGGAVGVEAAFDGARSRFEPADAVGDGGGQAGIGEEGPDAWGPAQQATRLRGAGSRLLQRADQGRTDQVRVGEGRDGGVERSQHLVGARHRTSRRAAQDGDDPAHRGEATEGALAGRVPRALRGASGPLDGDG